ncbi:hypothetical protein F5050DRAFT_1714491 [Lentinula boryana]|uniref:DUF6534 domain-containing protein n=1 Tax=Lentinula boryana TaxID=40481 RepID=A0ABQ8Q445_9AGAR|nr:hypothetical protein F5050DRAFT_1714491 [Lentinula boryana]
MSAPACAPLQVPDLNDTYGAMLIGGSSFCYIVILNTLKEFPVLTVYFSFSLQGILTLQTITYYDSYPRDPVSTKLIVATVWCFDTIHLVLIAQSVYHYLVNNWGFYPALTVSTWELDLNLTFIGLSSFLCQLFFLNRIWVFSRRNILLVGFLIALCTTTLVLDILVTVQIVQSRSVTEFGRRKGEIIAVFTSGALIYPFTEADVALSLLLCYYIRRSRSGFERTDSLIDLIVKYTITTGLVTSLNSRTKLRAALEGASVNVPASQRTLQVHKSTEVIQAGYSYNSRESSEEHNRNGIDLNVKRSPVGIQVGVPACIKR